MSDAPLWVVAVVLAANAIGVLFAVVALVVTVRTDREIRRLLVERQRNLPPVE